MAQDVRRNFRENLTDDPPHSPPLPPSPDPLLRLPDPFSQLSNRLLMAEPPLERLQVRLGPQLYSGSNSSVYKACNAATGEVLVLKVYEKSKGGQRLFDNECHLLRNLPTHPGIPKLHGIGKMDGKYFVALQYIPFPSLEKHMKKRGSFSVDEALDILQQLLFIVDYLRAHHFAHQDIKSSNILIDPANNRIWLIDFGLSESFHSEKDANSRELGTPLYMSPQVLARHPHHPLMADLWSCGVLLWELLIGAHPFEEVSDRRTLLGVVSSDLNLTNLPTRCRPLLAGLLKVHEPERMTLEEASVFLEKYFALKHPNHPAPALAEPKALRRSHSAESLFD